MSAIAPTAERIPALPGTIASPVSGMVLRRRRISMRVAPRAVVVSALVIILIVGVSCWSISVGDFPVPLREVVATVFGGGSTESQFIVETLRLPRILTGILVGAAFGLSGAIFQSLANNPLASPDVIGFNSGAALGAVFTIVILEGTDAQVALGGIAGGMLTAVLVYALAWTRGVPGYRLILIGIGIGYAATALNNYLLTRAQIFEVQRATVWMIGSLNGRTWEQVRILAGGMAILLPLTLLLGRSLRLLELGPDVATTLGVHTGRARLALAATAVTLAALATSMAGPIAFVALVAAPIARRVVRSPGATLIPSALIGALLLVSADLAARRVFAPTELPAGIAAAVIGAPYLLWLLAREIRGGVM